MITIHANFYEVLSLTHKWLEKVLLDFFKKHKKTYRKLIVIQRLLKGVHKILGSCHVKQLKFSILELFESELWKGDFWNVRHVRKSYEINMVERTKWQFKVEFSLLCACEISRIINGKSVFGKTPAELSEKNFLKLICFFLFWKYVSGEV